MEFLLLIISLWFIFSMIKSAFKAGSVINYGATDKAGWVYLIERDGYIKVDSCEYNPEGFVNELEKYVSSDVNAKESKVNLVYYYFFESYSKKEKLLLEFLTAASDKYKDSLLSKNTNTDSELILELIKVPEKSNWFKYECNYNKIHNRVISWFTHSVTRGDEKYNQLMLDTNKNLLEWNKVFLQKLPEIKLD